MKVKIDENEYELDDLSDKAKGQYASLRFVDAELARLSGQIAALQTARAAYGRALRESLNIISDNDGEVLIDHSADTISFD